MGVLRGHRAGSVGHVVRAGVPGRGGYRRAGRDPDAGPGARTGRGVPGHADVRADPRAARAPDHVRVQGRGVGRRAGPAPGAVAAGAGSGGRAARRGARDDGVLGRPGPGPAGRVRPAAKAWGFPWCRGSRPGTGWREFIWLLAAISATAGKIGNEATSCSGGDRGAAGVVHPGHGRLHQRRRTSATRRSPSTWSRWPG